MHTRQRRCMTTMISMIVLPAAVLAERPNQRTDAESFPQITQSGVVAAGAPASAPANLTKTVGSPPKLADKSSVQPQTGPGTGQAAPQEKKGAAPPESKPRRWSLTAAGSQRKDWLTGKDRFDWPKAYNAKKTLGLPDWLNASLEYRVRYESMGAPFAKGQTGSQYQVPMQTVLWMEANYQAFRVGFEFWDARQYGSKLGDTLNTTMVDVADFPQIYAAWSTQNLLDSGLGFEAKGGRMTMDLGSRRLVARNAFRNTTNAFTGVSFRLRDGAGAWQLQAFGTQPVVRLPSEESELVHNDYDWDQEQKNAVFTGIIGETSQLPWDSRGELYLYYLGEDAANSSNHRRLFTPGFRVFRQPKKGEWDFEGESIAQVGDRLDTVYDPVTGKGTKKELSTEAFFEHVQLGYTFDLPWEPRILVQYDYATGGLNGSKTVTNSFDTLFGARRWEYGPTGIFGPFARNNISSPGTRVFVTPHRDVTAFAAYRAWWMADSKAPWQQATGISLVDPTGESGDFLGHTVELSARWDAHENVAFETGWAYLIKGNFARNAPDAPADRDNVNYFYVQTQFRF
jgi:hypothetical protein